MRLGLFGLPGAGKGTQAERIARYYGLPHISTGNIFRDMKEGRSELAQEIREILNSGRLVSDAQVTEITFQRLRQPDCQSGFVLDGYPRTLGQAERLQSSRFALNALLCIDVDEVEIVRRLSERMICDSCNAIFKSSNLKDGEKVCPNDGSALRHRQDDSIEALETRIRIFEENWRPVVDFYRAKRLLIEIDGSGSEEKVFSLIKENILSHGILKTND